MARRWPWKNNSSGIENRYVSAGDISALGKGWMEGSCSCTKKNMIPQPWPRIIARREPFYVNSHRPWPLCFASLAQISFRDLPKRTAKHRPFQGVGRCSAVDLLQHLQGFAITSRSWVRFVSFLPAAETHSLSPNPLIGLNCDC
jgi:hypothetical protein